MEVNYELIVGSSIRMVDPDSFIKTGRITLANVDLQSKLDLKLDALNPIVTGNLTVSGNTITNNLTVNGNPFIPCSTYFNTTTPALTGLFQLAGTSGAPSCNFNGAFSTTNGIIAGNGNDLTRIRRNLNIDNVLRVGYNDATDTGASLTASSNKIETNGNIGCVNLTSSGTITAGSNTITGNQTVGGQFYYYRK